MMANKHVTVKVVLHAAGSPTLFHFETDDLPMGPDNHLYFWNCVRGNRFKITYVLDVSARPGFRFPTTLEALWVHESAICPTTACYWDEFRATAVASQGQNQGQKLIVVNKNEHKANFSYTLRVTDGTDWLELDPGGTNGNGGEIPLTWAVAAMTGAIVGLGSSFAINGFDAPTVTYGLAGAVVGAVVGFLFDRR